MRPTNFAGEYSRIKLYKEIVTYLRAVLDLPDDEWFTFKKSAAYIVPCLDMDIGSLAANQRERRWAGKEHARMHSLMDKFACKIKNLVRERALIIEPVVNELLPEVEAWKPISAVKEHIQIVHQLKMIRKDAEDAIGGGLLVTREW